MIIQNLVIFCLFVPFILGGKINSEKCMHHLNNHIKNNLKPYQVVLLTNPDSESVAEYVVAVVLRNLPHIRIDIEKMSSKDVEKSMKSPTYGILRKTSVFLLVSSYHNSTFSTNIPPSLNYLIKLSPGKVRPHVLLISINHQKSSFKAFLHQVWLRQFLDFTILEIVNGHGKSYPRKLESSQMLVHHYTPFTNNYVRKKCSANTVWFPKKLLNLHGYPIIAGLAFRPPYSLVKYDESGRLIDQNGADLETFNALTQAMNFSARIDSNVNSAVGVFQGTKATGMLGKLTENKINLLITSVLNFRPNADGALYGYSSTIEIESFVAVVPIMHKLHEEEILNLPNLFFGILLFTGFVFLFWAFLIHVRNHEKFWIPENIAALLLGVAIDIKPTLSVSRLFFVYFIAVGFCYSSNFLGGLTASHVKESEEVQFNSLKDLGNSNLVPMIHPNFFNMSLDDSEGLRVLRKKTISTELVDSLCPLMLVQHKNVTCLLMNAYAKQLVHVMRDSSGLPVAKILDNPLFIARRTLALERNSAYKVRFDQIITAFTESGLRMKWTNNYSDQQFIFNGSRFDEQTVMFVEDLGAVSKLGRILFFVTLPGYLLSFFVFVGEILLNRYFMLYNRK